MATESEIAWAAGLFEGEGCFSIWESRGGRFYVRAQLGMADGDVVERFAGIVGGGNIRKRARQEPGWSAIYEWSMTDSQGVKRLITTLLPWLGQRRTTKARAALAVLENVKQAAKNRTHCAKGHPYDEANTLVDGDGTYTWRRCRACKREYDAKRYATRGSRA